MLIDKRELLDVSSLRILSFVNEVTLYQPRRHQADSALLPGSCCSNRPFCQWDASCRPDWVQELWRPDRCDSRLLQIDQAPMH